MHNLPSAMPARRKCKGSGQKTGQVFGRLIEAIVAGSFPCGSVVDGTALARDCKVSQTLVHEAIGRAAERGFVVTRGSRPPIVRVLTVEDVRELYEVRELLEIHALDEAWPRVREQQVKTLRALAAKTQPPQASGWVKRCFEFGLALHDLWARSCGNSWLRAELKRHHQFLRVFQSWIAHDAEVVAASYAEHLRILEAIERRDKAEALSRLREHIHASAYLVEVAMPRQRAAGPGKRPRPVPPLIRG